MVNHSSPVFGVVQNPNFESSQFYDGVFRRRPYRVECTGSLLTSEVKRRRARLVLGWGTAREDLRVLPAFSKLLRHAFHSIVEHFLSNGNRCHVLRSALALERRCSNIAKRPALPHRPVRGTLSQNGYGDGRGHFPHASGQKMATAMGCGMLRIRAGGFRKKA